MLVDQAFAAPRNKIYFITAAVIPNGWYLLDGAVLIGLITQLSMIKSTTQIYELTNGSLMVDRSYPMVILFLVVDTS